MDYIGSFPHVCPTEHEFCHVKVWASYDDNGQVEFIEYGPYIGMTYGTKRPMQCSTVMGTEALNFAKRMYLNGGEVIDHYDNMSEDHPICAPFIFEGENLTAIFEDGQILIWNSKNATSSHFHYKDAKSVEELQALAAVAPYVKQLCTAVAVGGEHDEVY